MSSIFISMAYLYKELQIPFLQNMMNTRLQGFMLSVIGIIYLLFVMLASFNIHFCEDGLIPIGIILFILIYLSLNFSSGGFLLGIFIFVENLFYWSIINE